MTEFEKALQECLHDLEQGAARADECLLRYPEHARELAPVLFAREALGRAGQARLSEAFKVRVRAKLLQEMRAHPHTSRRRSAAPRSGFLFVRLAVSFFMILLALLVTGTAYAQSTLPGDVFYGWKLASENAWRAISSDPVETDLVIAERRVNELAVVSDDPKLRAQTLDVYLKTVTRLKSQTDPVDDVIARRLDSQIERLKKLGIYLSQVDPAMLPAAEPLPLDVTATPATQFPPAIVPTLEIPSELVPTFEVPPPIR